MDVDAMGYATVNQRWVVAAALRPGPGLRAGPDYGLARAPGELAGYGPTVISSVGVTASGDTPLDALIVKVNVPASVGSPESVPVLSSRASPGGSEPELTLNVGFGLPMASNV